LPAVLIFAVSITACTKKAKVGDSIVIGNWWEDYDVNTRVPHDDVDEMTLQWRKQVLKDSGLDIKEKAVSDWHTMLENATTSIMAGKPIAQALQVAPDWAMTLYRQGLLAPISDSKAVDLTTTTPVTGKQVAYNQETASAFTFNGKQYALSIGYGSSRHSVGVFFNKRCFYEAGLDPDLPYNMQKDGTWTWDNFLEICHKLTRDTNNDGRMETYALNIDFPLEPLVISNGASYIARDKTGKFYNATNSPEFLEALRFYKKMMNEGVLMSRPDGGTWDWFFASFKSGQIAMLIYSEWLCSTLVTEAPDDWGWVLMPKGPRVADYLFPTDEIPMVIPAVYKGEDLDKILTAINLWFTPVVDDWKAGLWSFYRDTRAVEETMAMVRGPDASKHGVFRNFLMIPGLDIGDINDHIGDYDDASQLIESVSPKWQALIDDANSIMK